MRRAVNVTDVRFDLRNGVADDGIPAVQSPLYDSVSRCLEIAMAARGWADL
jgi:hypothetical protein